MSEMKDAITTQPIEVRQCRASLGEQSQPDCASRSAQPAIVVRRSSLLSRNLVTGAILLCLAILVFGLSICGVQKIRESAAHMHSMNNLKQLGMAIQCYADSTETLPPAYGETPQVPGKTVSFFVIIHCYLDQWGDHPFPPPPDFSFPCYCAPLDPRNPQSNGTISHSTNGTVLPPPPKFDESPESGTFVTGRQPYGKDCGGRASTTIMLTERSGLDGAHQWSNLNNALGSPAQPPAVPQVGVEPSAYRENAPQGFTSRGCHVVLGDGSVRPIARTISLATWNWACDPTNGNPLPADW
jgi:hypothetical protein